MFKSTPVVRLHAAKKRLDQIATRLSELGIPRRFGYDSSGLYLEYDSEHDSVVENIIFFEESQSKIRLPGRL